MTASKTTITFTIESEDGLTPEQSLDGRRMFAELLERWLSAFAAGSGGLDGPPPPGQWGFDLAAGGPGFIRPEDLVAGPRGQVEPHRALMMSVDAELGKRAAACKGWRWMHGMEWHAPDHVDAARRWGRVGAPPPPGAFPDLRDAATMGCLLALVREANAEPFAVAEYLQSGWEVVAGRRKGAPGESVWPVLGDGPTEAAALVAALEAAP